MPRNPHDPRFLKKITKVNSRTIRDGFETAASEWGVGGFERNQPRFLEDDENRPPVPHPYYKHPQTGVDRNAQRGPVRLSTRGPMRGQGS